MSHYLTPEQKRVYHGLLNNKDYKWKTGAQIGTNLITLKILVDLDLLDIKFTKYEVLWRLKKPAWA